MTATIDILKGVMETLAPALVLMGTVLTVRGGQRTASAEQALLRRSEDLKAEESRRSGLQADYERCESERAKIEAECAKLSAEKRERDELLARYGLSVPQAQAVIQHLAETGEIEAVLAALRREARQTKTQAQTTTKEQKV